MTATQFLCCVRYCARMAIAWLYRRLLHHLWWAGCFPISQALLPFLHELYSHLKVFDTICSFPPFAVVPLTFLLFSFIAWFSFSLMFRLRNGLFRVYISWDETRVSTSLLLPSVYFGSSHVCCNLVPALFSLPIPYLSVSVYFFLFLHFNIIISHVSFSLSHVAVLLFTSNIFHCFSFHYSSFHLLHSTFIICCNVNSHSS